MPGFKSNILLAALAGVALAGGHGGHGSQPSKPGCTTPTANLRNGTYIGVTDSVNNQEYFLGMPYAQAPTGSLRFAAPQPLQTSFSEPRSATQYGKACIGYGSDTTNLGTGVTSEDCLSINVVRPAGTQPGDDLPVGVWVHGGSYVMGSSRDTRYNLTWIVEQSVKEGKPIIAASINYRVSYWGFLFSEEMQDAGAGNIAFRDQRMALQWVQDNIQEFGGSARDVTIWGESAGARSLGMQLVAHDGNHGSLFSRAVLESGSPVAKYANATTWQSYFDALVSKTGCSSSKDALKCLRKLDWQVLNSIFNGSVSLGVTAPTLSAVVDGDFMTGQGAVLLNEGKFARVPLLLGNNFDEGTAYAKTGINTTEQFQSYLSSLGLGADQVSSITELYPDDLSVGIPASYPDRPAAYPYGLQYKRVAAFAGDYQQHAGRRHLAESYAGAGLCVYSYLWNVYVNGIAAIYGATHFQEVAFVFDNTEGLGYATNPFEGKPETFKTLADLMSKMWVSFMHGADPNLDASETVQSVAWPRYTLDAPNNLVFDVNATGLSYVAEDSYRKENIAYLLDSVFV